MEAADISDGIQVSNTVAGESDGHTYLSQEFKSEPEEITVEMESEYYDCFEMKVKQDCNEGEEQTVWTNSVREKESNIKADSDSFNQMFQCRSMDCEIDPQTSKQIHSKTCHDVCAETAGSSTSCLSNQDESRTYSNPEDTVIWLPQVPVKHEWSCDREFKIEDNSALEISEDPGPASQFENHQIIPSSAPGLHDERAGFEEKGQMNLLLDKRKAGGLGSSQKIQFSSAHGRKLSKGSRSIEHSSIHTDEESLECSVCEKEFSLRKRLINHMMSHTREKQCSVCNKKFSRNCTLTNHMMAHTAIKPHWCKKPYKCTVCGKNCSDKPKLNAHMKVHTGEKQYDCNVCGMKFFHKSRLTAHVMVHSGEKPYTCAVCETKFSHKFNLNAHMKIHTGEQPYECTICGKKFVYKNKVIDHLRSHTGEKPFECNVCWKKFALKSSLITHMRVHTGEKPFTCTVCGKKFPQKGRLNIHMRTHTGEKPYDCAVCGRKFSEIGTLNKHIRIHTGEKPFECTVCGRKYSVKSSMNIHMKTHTDEHFVKV